MPQGTLSGELPVDLQSLSGVGLNLTPRTAPLAADYLRDLGRQGVVS